MNMKRRRHDAPQFARPPYDSGKGKYAPQVHPIGRTDVVEARIREIYEDNLICELWDVESEDYILEMPVAKALHFRQTPVTQNVFDDHVRTYVYSGLNQRTVHYTTTGDSTPYKTVTETLEPPYYVGEIILVTRFETYNSGEVGTTRVSNQIYQSGYTVNGVSSPYRETKPAELTAPANNPMEPMPQLGSDPYITWQDVNAAGRRWVSDVGKTLRAIAYADWEMGSPRGHAKDYADAKQVDEDGLVTTGDVIRIYFPDYGGTYGNDPAIYEGDYFTYTIAEDGQLLANHTPYSRLLDTKFILDTTPPTGWAKCDNAALPADAKISGFGLGGAPGGGYAPDGDGMVMVNAGSSDASASGVPGNTFGHATHGNGTNDHTDHVVSYPNVAQTGGTGNIPSASSVTLTHSETNNHQPSMEGYWVIRYK